MANFLEAMNSLLAASAHLLELVDCFTTSNITALTIGLFWKGFLQIKTKVIMQFWYFLKTPSSQFCKLSKTDKMLCKKLLT